MLNSKKSSIVMVPPLQKTPSNAVQFLLQSVEKPLLIHAFVKYDINVTTQVSSVISKKIVLPGSKAFFLGK